MVQGYPDPSPQVLAALARGRKIEAIKLYRAATGLGLREAKNVIDRIEQGGVSGSDDVVVRTFTGDQVSLARQLDDDFRTMAGQGYVVASQTAKPGRRTVFKRHPQDEVTVTYRRSSEAARDGAGQSQEQDRYAQLERIGRLKAEGVLTDEEFEREKHRILGY